MSETDYTKNSIAAVNPLFGVVNFIVLSLPYGWKVRGERLPPTIDKIIRRNNVKWVSSGRIVSIYYSSGFGGTIDIEVFDGDKRYRWGGEEVNINGHVGLIRNYKVRRGVIKRHWVEVIDIVLYCDVTNRSIRIRMYGKALGEHLYSIMKSVTESICH